MARQIINIGTTPRDRTGDRLRTAFKKVNENFAELYAGGFVGSSAGGGNGYTGSRGPRGYTGSAGSGSGASTSFVIESPEFTREGSPSPNLGAVTSIEKKRWQGSKLVLFNRPPPTEVPVITPILTSTSRTTATSMTATPIRGLNSSRSISFQTRSSHRLSSTHHRMSFYQAA